MFDLLTSEQGLMSRRTIAVDVQQTGCRVPSRYFPEAKGIFMITSHKHFCSHYTGGLLLCPQLLVTYCKDAHTLQFAVFWALCDLSSHIFSVCRKGNHGMLTVEGRGRGGRCCYQASSRRHWVWMGGRERWDLSVAYVRSRARSCFGSSSCDEAEKLPGLVKQRMCVTGRDCTLRGTAKWLVGWACLVFC